MDEELLQAIAVTAELTGTEMSKAAAKIFAQDLARYPLRQVLAALTRCRRECRGRLTLSDVLTRIDDGRPGAEEAWAMIPKDEYKSGVWTEEMQRAMGVAFPLMNEGEMVAARMAFKEAYTRECQKARDEGLPVRWSATLGFDKPGREEAKHEAKNRNLLAQGLEALPYIAPEHANELTSTSPRLEAPKAVGDVLATLRGRLRGSVTTNQG